MMIKKRAYCVTAHAWHNENEKVKLTVIARNKENAVVEFFKEVSMRLWNVTNVEEVLK